MTLPQASIPPPQNFGLPGGDAILVANNPALLPFPAYSLAGAGGETWPWVVVVNSSPFTLKVTSVSGPQSGGTNITGPVLGFLAPYTQDLFYIPGWTQNSAIGLLPMMGSEALPPGIDETAWAIWFPDTPPGQYPSGIGVAPNPGGLSNLLATNSAGGGTIFFAPLPIPTGVEAIAIRGRINGGTAHAAQVTVTDSYSNVLMQTDVSIGQTLFVAVFGDQNLSIQVTALGGGTLGIWAVYGIATNGVIDPSLTPQGLGGQQIVGPQPPVTVTVAVASSSALIAAPPVGYMIRVRGWSYFFALAPHAAGFRVALKTTTGNTFLIQQLTRSPAQIESTFFPVDFWIPDQVAGGNNTPDGLSGQNDETVQPVTMTVMYEVWPTRLSPYSF